MMFEKLAKELDDDFVSVWRRVERSHFSRVPIHFLVFHSSFAAFKEYVPVWATAPRRTIRNLRAAVVGNGPRRTIRNLRAWSRRRRARFFRNRFCRRRRAKKALRFRNRVCRRRQGQPALSGTTRIWGLGSRSLNICGGGLAQMWGSARAFGVN